MEVVREVSFVHTCPFLALAVHGIVASPVAASVAVLHDEDAADDVALFVSLIVVLLLFFCVLAFVAVHGFHRGIFVGVAAFVAENAVVEVESLTDVFVR